MKTLNSLKSLVQSYLSGAAEGSYNSTFIKEGELISKSLVVAKRTGDGEVLLTKTVDIPEDLNDELVTQLASTGTKFSRIGDIRNLLNPTARLDDLKNGKVEQFATIVKLYGGDPTSLQLGAHEALVAYDKKVEQERKGLAAKVKELEDRVTSFFNNKKTEQAAKQRELEMAALAESVRTALVDFEAGKPLTAAQIDHITKDTHRLRTVTRSKGRIDVQSTSGQYTSLNMIRQAFNKLAPYLWGGKELTSNWERRQYEGGSFADVGNVRGHTIKFRKINENKIIVGMGCQQVNKSELERFALGQGWPLDGTAVPA